MSRFLSTFSRGNLARLYEKRRALDPMAGNRTRLAIVISLIMLFSLFAFVASIAWIRSDVTTYLQSRARIKVQDMDASVVSISAYTGRCSTLICPESLEFSSQIQNITGKKLVGLPLSLEKPTRFVVRFRIQEEQYRSLFLYNKALVIALPRMQFEHAFVFLNSNVRLSAAQSSRLDLAIMEEERLSNLDIVVVLNPRPLQTHLVSPVTDEPMFIAPVGDYNDFISFLNVYRAGRSGFAALIARIVMAIFVLALFIFVDSSPESLALALFLGFEGFALSITYGWLPLGNIGFLLHFFSQMGDVFRLYFALQLARLIAPSVGKWLFWGTLISIPYGLIRHYELVLGYQKLALIPIWRDLLIGSLATFICIRVALFLKGKGHNFRMAALLVASFGFFQQFLEPLPAILPQLASIPHYISFMNLYTPASYYLLAISAFINIATLEARVRSLSSAQTRVNIMERELEMGRAVQTSLLHMPRLPDEFKVVHSHKAALFVSGDTFFVHWDKSHEKLTLLLNDVTGHGIHAALKASACNAIARTLWYSRQDTRGVDGSKLAAYDRLIQEFIDHQEVIPKDINAMIGAEFHKKSGHMLLYRANFCFPLILSKQKGQVHVRVLPLLNRKIETIRFESNSVLLLVSDGIVTSGEDVQHLRKFLEERLSDATEKQVDLSNVKQLIMDWRKTRERPIHDDETLLGFQWVA